MRRANSPKSITLNCGEHVCRINKTFTGRCGIAIPGYPFPPAMIKKIIVSCADYLGENSQA